jgi:hypothetical protein
MHGVAPGRVLWSLLAAVITAMCELMMAPEMSAVL